MAKLKPKVERARSDMACGAAFSIFSIAFYAATYTFRSVTIKYTIGAAFMPRLLAVIVGACAVYLLIRGYRLYSTCTEEEKKEIRANNEKSRMGQIRCCLIIVDLLAAAFTFKSLGFLLTMPWMMFFMFVILEKKGKRKYLLYVILSIVIPIVVFFGFYYGFSQLLPCGILKPFLSQFL